MKPKHDKSVLALLLFLTWPLPFGSLSAEQQGYIAVKPSAVLRAGPTVNSAPIKYLAYGTEVEILSQHPDREYLLGTIGHYSEIRIGNTTGFVFSPLISRSPEEEIRLMNGEIVPDWYFKSKSEDSFEGFPLPPPDCRSFEHYVITSLKKSEPDKTILRDEPPVFFNTIIRHFEGGIQQVSNGQLESYYQILKLPMNLLPTAHRIISRCTPFSTFEPLTLPYEERNCPDHGILELKVTDIGEGYFEIEFGNHGGSSCEFADSYKEK